MKKIFIITIGLLMNLEARAMIYHLIQEVNFSSRIKNEHLYEPSLESEGFIHNATITQVVPVANRHYKDANDTLLLVIDEKLLDSQLRYDFVEKYKEYFPHVYGPINLSAIIKTYAMQKNIDGTYRLPKDLP